MFFAIARAIDIKVLQTLGLARDRPSPYGEGWRFLRKAFFPVARGPVPRDLSTAAENARSPETTDVCCSDRCLARDRPSPYGEGDCFFPSRGGLSPAIVGLREAWRGTGPRPTVRGGVF